VISGFFLKSLIYYEIIVKSYFYFQSLFVCVLSSSNSSTAYADKTQMSTIIFYFSLKNYLSTQCLCSFIHTTINVKGSENVVVVVS